MGMGEMGGSQPGMGFMGVNGLPLGGGGSLNQLGQHFGGGVGPAAGGGGGNWS